MACKVVPVKFTAPKLNYVKRFSQDNEECAKISWESDLGQQYYVYRKTFGRCVYETDYIHYKRKVLIGQDVSNKRYKLTVEIFLGVKLIMFRKESFFYEVA